MSLQSAPRKITGKTSFSFRRQDIGLTRCPQSKQEVYVHANQIYRLLRFRIFLFHPFQKELSEEMAYLCHADLGIRYEVNHLTADFCL